MSKSKLLGGKRISPLNCLTVSSDIFLSCSMVIIFSFFTSIFFFMEGSIEINSFKFLHLKETETERRIDVWKVWRGFGQYLPTAQFCQAEFQALKATETPGLF